MQNLSVVVRAHQHRNGHADDEADAVNKDAEDEAIVEEDEEEQDGMHIDGISSDEEEEEEGIPAWEEYTSEDDYGTGGGESSDDDDCFSDKKKTNSEVEEAEEDDDDVICIKCKRGDDACVLLLCDGLACTTPPVAFTTFSAGVREWEPNWSIFQTPSLRNLPPRSFRIYFNLNFPLPTPISICTERFASLEYANWLDPIHRDRFYGSYFR